jgi:hypothetical protein
VIANGAVVLERWLASLVLAAGCSACVWLQQDAARVVASTGVRQDQLGRLLALTAAPGRQPVDDSQLAPIADLFAGHRLEWSTTAAGAFVTVRAGAADEVGR